MANSDNVVRVGLTPKFKDAKTLVDILDYETGPVSVLEGSADSAETAYQTPASEFEVSRWEIKPHTERREPVRGRVGVLLVTKGDVLVRWGTKVDGGEEVFQQGQAFLIPACLNEFKIRTTGLAELYRVQVPDP